MLREMLNSEGVIMAPGAYDVWSARLVEKAGFKAIYMTGYGVSASVLGKPDIGLITMQEMAEMARNMANATSIPIIADADNGYGSSLNVIRTIQEYEQGGIAGIQLEDQIFPKRCGHMEGKQLVPMNEMVSKIKAAVYARRDPDTVIIARTDARAVISFEEALTRAQAYVEAGADVIFLEAPQSVEEVKKVAEIIKVPLLANMVENGKTPLFTVKELEEIGYKIAIYPATPLYTATKAIMDVLEVLKKEETNAACMDREVDFPTFNKMVGVPEMRNLEKSFLVE
ncbi:MAG: isocitrate lyase/PEP mutase family protein [Bacillota bacterium]|nr:isocitrate lyase/PEP mutase family protein [Bacillota bacterium]